jgi:hypothetical protein
MTIAKRPSTVCAKLTSEAANQPDDHCQLASCETKNGLRRLIMSDESGDHKSEACTCPEHKDYIVNQLKIVFVLFISQCECCH